MAASSPATTNGNGLSGLPPWARALATLVFQHGVSAAIALALLYIVTQRLMTDVRDLQTELRAHAAVTSATSSAFSTFSGVHADDSRALIVLMRRICINTARSDQQRQECVR
jgi:hypothetical protein